MKKIMFLACTLLTLAITTHAQLKEGKVSYSMEVSSDNPDMAMASNMMAGSKFNMSFAPGKSRSDITMGSIGDMTTITNENSGKILMLTNMMGMKYAVETSLDENKKSAGAAEGDFTVTPTSETKQLLGFTCKKAIMKSKTLGENDITIWYTTDIKASTTGQQYYDKSMPGFPLEMNMEQKGMKIHFLATAVEKTVPASVFEMTVPAGYEKKTMEELEKMGQ